MPFEAPVISLAWYAIGRFHVNWTHSGTDVVSWYMQAWETGTDPSHPPGYYITTTSSYDTALRQFPVPLIITDPLPDDISVSVKVFAFYATGYAESPTCTILNGHIVSHTFFDGVVTDIWEEHDSIAINFGDVVPTVVGEDWLWQPSMDFTHISDYGPLPTDFLPTNAIPLAVTGGIEFANFIIETTNTPTYDSSIDHRTYAHPQLFGRPDGYTPPWDVEPTPWPGTGTVGGLHTSSEWLGSPSFIGAYKRIDFILQEFNYQGGWGTNEDPQTRVGGVVGTGSPWTRANVMSYKWGWAWYSWTGYIGTANQNGLFINPTPPPTIITRPVREVVSEGRIKMFKVHVHYAYPGTCPGDPPVNGGGGNGGGTEEPDKGGIYYINPAKIIRNDSYYGDTEKKIPDPTVRTAFIGE